MSQSLTLKRHTLVLIPAAMRTCKNYQIVSYMSQFSTEVTHIPAAMRTVSYMSQSLTLK